jgi:hypothetical protein
VFPDGKSFVMVQTPPDERRETRRLNVILNWAEQLARLAPTQ